MQIHGVYGLEENEFIVGQGFKVVEVSMNKTYVQITILVDTDQVNPEDIPSLIKRRVPEAKDVYLEWIDDEGEDYTEYGIDDEWELS